MRILSRTRTAACTALAAILFAGTGLVASAQSVAPTSGTATCIPSNSTNLSYTFAPGANQTLTGWQVLGDLQITSGASPLTNPVIVQSTGPGRGRIIAQYSIGASCPQQAFYQVNKTFAQPADDQFLGPDCIETGKQYGFVVPPLVSSQALINAQIGIDTYDWNPSGVGATAFPAGSSLTYSGDRSALSLTLPNNFTGTSFVFKVKIGTCNSAYMTKTVFIKPKTPILTVTTGSATCKTDLSPFTLSYTVEAGVIYTWNGIPNGWTLTLPNSTPSGAGVTYATPGVQTATITPNSSTVADVSVTAGNSAGGSCSASPSLITRISRQLTTTDNPITATVNGSAVVGCLPSSGNVTFTFNSALPANSLFTWTLPSGWAPTAATGNSITVPIPTSGSVDGNVTAQVAGCTTGGTVLAVKVSGTKGCAFNVDDPLTCGQYRVRGVPSATCVGNQFDWKVTDAGGTVIATSDATNGTTVNFWKPTVAIPTGSRVSVRVRGANCLDAQSNVFTTTYDTDPSTQCRPAGPLGTTGTTGNVDMVAYPNPTGSELRIALPAQEKGTTKLTLVDATGRRVLSTTTSDKQQVLDVRRLPDGIYTLQATLSNGKVLTQKVAVNH